MLGNSAISDDVAVGVATGPVGAGTSELALDELDEPSTAVFSIPGWLVTLVVAAASGFASAAAGVLLATLVVATGVDGESWVLARCAIPATF